MKRGRGGGGERERERERERFTLQLDTMERQREGGEWGGGGQIHFTADHDSETAR